jgi:plasmid stabilization system protein ParE
VNVRFLTLAQQEIHEAVIWFNEQVDGMGMDFLDELARVVRLVKSFPLASTEVEAGVRKRLFARFPYSLIYGVEDRTIVVVAVAHSRRAPRYWLDRI